MPSPAEELRSRRDEADREDVESRGAVFHNDPAVFDVARVISSTGSTAAQTTFLCELVELTQAEVEGTALAYRNRGMFILAVNISKTRPVANDIVPIFKAGDRLAMVAT